jgi:hypothetical protein
MSTSPRSQIPAFPGAGNRVSVSDGNMKVIVHQDEPEPTDIVVSRNGALYWTCKSAGVILQRVNGETSVLLDGLDSPVGIALDHKGETLLIRTTPRSKRSCTAASTRRSGPFFRHA